jgi:hypothetical protein
MEQKQATKIGTAIEVAVPTEEIDAGELRAGDTIIDRKAGELNVRRVEEWCSSMDIYANKHTRSGGRHSAYRSYDADRRVTIKAR